MHLFQDKKAEIVGFLTQPFTSYLQHMGKNGTYADHVCLQSLSSMLKLDILVIHAKEADVKLVPGSETTTLGSIVIGYIPEMQHYVSLEILVR